MKKQVFEMAMLITEGARPAVDDARAIYNAGYRKASTVAEEIFAEIDKLIIHRMIADSALIDDRLITDIAELKKKCTEG